MAAIASGIWTNLPQVTAAPETITSGTVPTEWWHRRRDLLEIRKYQDGWNGFGADAPDPKMVDAAISFLHVLERRGDTPPMRVTLSPDGLVAMEWQGDGGYWQAEIVSEREVEWMRVAPGRPTEFHTELLTLRCRDKTPEFDWQFDQQSRAPGVVASGFAY